MTPEQLEQQIEKRLKETADTIEDAVGDIKTNMATKKEVLDLITERTTEDKEILKAAKADVEKLNTGVVEANAEIDELKLGLRNLRRAKMQQPLWTERGRYNGHFSSPQEARAFALLVMAATMNGHSRFASRLDEIKKSLDSMGIDPYWVDGNGHKKDMTGSSQAAGGALVTVEQIPGIIMLLEKYGRYRANAQLMPMGAGETLQPKSDGLLPIYCPGEGGTITKGDPEIKAVALTPKTMCGLTAYSMELEDDSLVYLGEMLAGLFARSFAYYEDLCGFLGDGTSTYFGFKGIAGALLAVDATIGNIKSLVVGSGSAYSELVLGDFQKVIGTLPEMADDGMAKWYEHRYFYWTVFVALAIASAGTPASEVIIGAGQKQKLQFGYPVEFTQVMPKAEANSQICSVFGNLRQGAMLGTRGGIEFAQSSERYFDQGLIAVRGRDRVAINVHGVGDTTDAGVICGLITAAS